MSAAGPGSDRLVEIKNDLEFYDVIMENGEIRRVLKPEFEHLNTSSIPGLDPLIIKTPSLSRGPIPGFFVVILILSLVTTVLIFLVRECEQLRKVGKYFANHILFVSVGLVLAATERLLPFTVDHYLVLNQSVLNLLWIPIIYHVSYAFYHPLVLVQLPKILFSGIVSTTIIIFLAGFINVAIFNAIHDQFMTYAAGLSFSTAMLGSDVLSVYSYFDSPPCQRTEATFYFLFGYHAVSSITVAEIYSPVSSLIGLSYHTVIPFSSYVFLFLRGIIRLLGSLVLGVICGLLAVLFGRITRTNRECEYFEPANILLTVALSVFSCAMFNFSLLLGPLTCCLLQQRYLFPNISDCTVSVIKNISEALALECGLFYFVVVGYKVTGNWIDLDLWFAIQTTLVVYFVKCSVILTSHAIFNRIAKKKTSYGLQALLMFGCFKSPRTLLYISRMSIKPYSRLFHYAQFFVVLFNVIIDSILSKFIIRNMKKEFDDCQAQGGEDAPAWVEKLKRMEKPVYKFLAGEQKD